jgi:hypothetical protein
LAVHPGQAADFPFRHLDPIVRPTLQRLAAQKPHLLDQPLFGRVRLPEIAVEVPHRAHDRRHPVAKTRMGRRIPSIAESLAYTSPLIE